MQKCFTLCRLILLELSHHNLINEKKNFEHHVRDGILFLFLGAIKVINV